MSETLDISQPIIEHQYAKEWHEYRLRGRILLFLFIGYLPFGVLTDFLLDAFLGSNQTLMAIAAFSWMAAYGIAGWRFGSFRCPRCREQFFCRKGLALSGGYNPFSKHCRHCGLEKWAGE